MVTVAELIAHLSVMPPNAVVLMNLPSDVSNNRPVYTNAFGVGTAVLTIGMDVFEYSSPDELKEALEDARKYTNDPEPGQTTYKCVQTVTLFPCMTTISQESFDAIPEA